MPQRTRFAASRRPFRALSPPFGRTGATLTPPSSARRSAVWRSTLSELKALREELEAVREGEAAGHRLEAAERREAEARAVELKALNRQLRSQSAA